MSIELTEEQYRAVRNGLPVSLEIPDVDGRVVLVPENKFRELEELAADQRLQEAWLDAVEEARLDVIQDAN